MSFYAFFMLKSVVFSSFDAACKRKSVILLTQKFASVTALETSFTKFGCNAKCQIFTKLSIFWYFDKIPGSVECLWNQLNYSNKSRQKPMSYLIHFWIVFLIVQALVPKNVDLKKNIFFTTPQKSEPIFFHLRDAFWHKFVCFPRAK